MQIIENESENRRYVTIALTEACNLDCTYCYENHKSSNKISIETLKDIVRREMTTETNFSNVEFDLFGGEPFLEFEKIKVNFICRIRAVNILHFMCSIVTQSTNKCA